MRLKFLAAAAWVLLTAARTVAAQPAAPLISVWVELAGPSTADVELAARGSAATSPGPDPGPARLAEICAEQGALTPLLSAAGCRVIGRCTALLNAVHVLAPEDGWRSLATLPGVRRVSRGRQYKPALTKSVPFVGAPKVWTGVPGATGAGVRIGIIDSGIDYLHADFGGSGKASDYLANDPAVVEPGTFPTAKVVDGYDFVGDNYDASDPAKNTPQPDPDPLDPSANGHGTHVAGIAAGFGVTAAGKRYAGPYTTNLPASGFLVGPGVAPQASLVAYKIFGASGSTEMIAEALDRAADPNQDGRTSDRLDVVNLSVGSSFGIDDPADPELVAVQKLANLGTLVAIAAGNEGDTMYIVGAPGVAPGAITAANSIDNGQIGIGVVVSTPASASGSYPAVDGSLTPALSVVGPVAGAVAGTAPADACDTLSNAPALRGKIALIVRGSCFFADKIRRAQAAGAKAVIMINNVDGPPVAMGASGDTSDITVPGVMIGKADGAKIQAALAAGQTVNVRLDASVQVVESYLADQLDDSSSRGPALTDDHLKPDLAAPGHNILSAQAGSGTQGISYSGTSMATPHLAGAAALLRQLHPAWPAEDIKAALMNTGAPTRDGAGNPYPASRTGAGRLQVDAAASTAVIAKAVSSDLEVSLALGGRTLTGPVSFTRDLIVVNHGLKPVTLAVASSNVYAEPGLTVVPLSSNVTVAAGGSTVVHVGVTADPSQFVRPAEPTTPAANPAGVPHQRLPESSGALWLTGGATPLHVPWHGVFRAASRLSSTVRRLGAPTSAGAAAYFATRGASAHDQPLASLFLLGATNANHGFTDNQAATDLVAVGASSDFHRAGDLASTTLYFGLAVAGAWTTPQRALYNFDVEIDLNGDGVAEYTVVNGDAGTYSAGDADSYDSSTPALESLVREEATGNLTEEAPLNVLAPSFRDTAPFRNSVLVHTARAADIGLGAGSTSFRYRVVTQGNFSDQTDWIPFDAAAPVLDPSPYGLNQSPLFDEGLGLAAAYYPADAAAAGFTAQNPPTVLLLHQHNLPGASYDLVVLDPHGPDSDGDGLPDSWEIQYFGDLSQTAAESSNGDGVSNAEKLARALDPAAPFASAVNAVAPKIRWTSWTGYHYVVERAPNAAGPYVDISPALSAASAVGRGTNEFTDVPPPGGRDALFYRVRRQ